MRKNIIIALLLAGLLGGASNLHAQDRKTLEANKAKLEKEIEQTNKQIKETGKKKKATETELKLVNANINQRTQLIKGLNREVELTNREINKLESKINRLTNDIENLKKEYARLIYSAWQHRNRFSSLMFILASDNFNQAIRRIRYISQYNDYIAKQVGLINEKQEVLQSSKANLEKEKEGKKKLVDQQQQEKQKLQKEKKEKDRIVAQLNKQQKDLKNKLAQQQKKVNELNAKIQKIINDEIRRSQEEAKKKGGSGSGVSFALTPQEKALSSDFANNKGKLPWPVERGTISGTFGTHPHPAIPSIQVTNNGIDILTEKNADARAVFKGEVANIGSVYGLKFVMVRHGEYISVYANLDKVYVKQGDKVDTKQKIGRVYHDSDEVKTELQFQIWKGTTKVNPEGWIAK